MTASTARTNQRYPTLTQRIGNQLVSLPAQSSTRSAPASQKPARSFVAVLLNALSAFAA